MKIAKMDLRVAVLADIHANSIALEAVLNDIKNLGGVDEYWLLGDYVALGHDPVRVLEQLSVLKNARFVRGNTERYIADPQMLSPSAEEVKDYSPNEIARHIHMACSFAWTLGALATRGWLPWLTALALEERIELPDGTRTLIVHASPGKDEGSGVNPTTTADALRMMVADSQADLILVGHTHSICDYSVDGVRVINPGSVSNPLPPDLRASYALLEAGQGGYELTIRHVDYDREAVIEAMHRLQQPSRDYVIRLTRGQVKPEWE